MITNKGIPAAYLVDADSYEQMKAKLRLLEGIARGEQSITEGNIHSQQQAKRLMAQWLK